MYIGEFKTGNQHGRGTFTDIDGLSKNGIWVDGKRTQWV